MVTSNTPSFTRRKVILGTAIFLVVFAVAAVACLVALTANIDSSGGMEVGSSASNRKRSTVVSADSGLDTDESHLSTNHEVSSTMLDLMCIPIVIMM